MKLRHKKRILNLVMIFYFITITGCKDDKILLFENSNFELGNLTHWEVDGSAFEAQPIFDYGSLREGAPSNYEGSYFIGTYEINSFTEGMREVQGDLPKGRLKSEEFLIMEDRIGFLLGGGQGTNLTGVALEIAESQVLFEPGRGIYTGSEKMYSVVWDVREWKGQKARILIIDLADSGWGHINADDFGYIT